MKTGNCYLKTFLHYVESDYGGVIAALCDAPPTRAYATHPDNYFMMESERPRSLCFYDRVWLLPCKLRVSLGGKVDALDDRRRGPRPAIPSSDFINMLCGVCPVCGETVVIYNEKLTMGIAGGINPEILYRRVRKTVENGFKIQIWGSCDRRFRWLFSSGLLRCFVGDGLMFTGRVPEGAWGDGFFEAHVDLRGFARDAAGGNHLEDRLESLETVYSIRGRPKYETMKLDADELLELAERMTSGPPRRRRAERVDGPNYPNTAGEKTQKTRGNSPGVAAGGAVVTAAVLGAGVVAGAVAKAISVSSDEAEKMKNSVASKYSEVKTVIE